MRTVSLFAIYILLTAMAQAFWHGDVHPGAQYYLAPAGAGGSDSNNGLSIGAPWLTPNHALNCGDTINMAAGAYSPTNFLSGKWGTVANCPSAGGIYAAQLKCAGPDVSSCTFSATNTDALHIDKSNWAVVGGKYSSTSQGCMSTTPSTTETLHHIAFINVVTGPCASDGVASGTYSGNRHYGVDQLAVVGAIAYDAANGSSACYSGISDWDPVNYDTTPGTHVFVAGIFAWANINPNPCNGGAPSDGEGIIFDNWNNSQGSGIAYTGQGVIEQSLLLGNGNAGITIGQNTAAQIKIVSTTAYGDVQDTALGSGGNRGEIGLLASFNVSITSSIMQATLSTQNGSNVYAFDGYLTDTTSTITNSYMFGVGGNNWHVDNSAGFVLGAGVTQATPNFVSPSVPSAPNCAGYATTTACMASVIANFVPQAAGAVGLGYQPPGACAADALYPTWLKGLVPAGLITKPCNM